MQSDAAAFLKKRSSLKCGLDLKSPGLQQCLRDVLGVFIAARPLAQPGGADVLVGSKLVLLDDLLERGDGGDDGADGLGLAPVGISAAFCHSVVCSSSRADYSFSESDNSLV